MRARIVIAAAAVIVNASCYACSPSDFSVSNISFSPTSLKGTIYMRGVIKNNCGSAAGVQHKLAFYDKAGNLLFTKDAWFASIKNIPAHSDWPFQTTIEVDRFEKYTIQAIDVQTWR